MDEGRPTRKGVGAASSKRRSTNEELFAEHSLPRPRIDMHCDAITGVQASIAESDPLGLLVPRLYDCSGLDRGRGEAPQKCF
ncbi:MULTISPECIES: hypothetical protein [unclassified Caballeronia]|uniref:hypothetical protein n=1 Tax=unclassified Caballeronia TaxID=2646786 RepID=UPI001F406173|nr:MULTISPECIES: hypothetical protein [unclassified Caballeronia]MCE4541722.1 hypothetical protein [Caballeronia sp. PC1]MCE4569234.1 hypothetical protein [Caballeronia sp. CLC5]